MILLYALRKDMREVVPRVAGMLGRRVENGRVAGVCHREAQHWHGNLEPDVTQVFASESASNVAVTYRAAGIPTVILHDQPDIKVGVPDVPAPLPRRF